MILENKLKACTLQAKMHSDTKWTISLYLFYFIFPYLYYYKVDAHIKNGQLKKN